MASDQNGHKADTQEQHPFENTHREDLCSEDISPNTRSSETQDSAHPQNDESAPFCPLLTFMLRILRKLNISDTERIAVQNHLNQTTWPTLFLSIEDARAMLSDSSRWTAEDDTVLMSLPQVSSLTEDAINDAFFPCRLFKEVIDRRNHLNDGHYQPDQKFQGQVMKRIYEVHPNGPDVVEELMGIHDLLAARKQALLSLRKESTVKKSTGQHQVSFNELLRARATLDQAGWPGIYRDLKSFANAGTPPTLSHQDANSLHALKAANQAAITWIAIKKVFFPDTPDNEWRGMQSAVYHRRVWSTEETAALKQAYEKNELDKFAKERGRTLNEVTLKAHRWFYNPEAGVPSAMPAAPVTPKAPPRAKPLPSSSSKKRKRFVKDTSPANEVDDEELLWKTCSYYSSDAYNLVRLFEQGIDFEALSQLSLRGTYTSERLKEIYSIIGESWKELIWEASYPEFQKLFIASFMKWYRTSEMNIGSRDETPSPDAKPLSGTVSPKTRHARAATFTFQTPQAPRHASQRSSISGVSPLSMPQRRKPPPTTSTPKPDPEHNQVPHQQVQYNGSNPDPAQHNPLSFSDALSGHPLHPEYTFPEVAEAAFQGFTDPFSGSRILPFRDPQLNYETAPGAFPVSQMRHSMGMQPSHPQNGNLVSRTQAVPNFAGQPGSQMMNAMPGGAGYYYQPTPSQQMRLGQAGHQQPNSGGGFHDAAPLHRMRLPQGVQRQHNEAPQNPNANTGSSGDGQREHWSGMLEYRK